METDEEYRDRTLRTRHEPGWLTNYFPYLVLGGIAALFLYAFAIRWLTDAIIPPDITG